MTIEEIIKSNAVLPIEKKVVLNILYANNVIAEKFNEVLKPFDISSEQFNVLRILRGQQGLPANMFLIQERMLAKTSNTTRLVDKLLLKNLVTREICPNNRRKMEVAITEKGLALLEALDPKVQDHERNFAINMSPEEMEQLNALLEKFRTFSRETKSGS
ncbi:MAG: MarR family transcriptional regulator [Flavobacterium sp. BFFFF1]|uniref:MarR family winged helix-turn-helix transcriptional regulator n=1 Tax=Flavobacterium sp. BFFFF1 TaxID=2015557 RepID=UPI000BCDD65C|nr:MarR family transcriptional regulator [Flavobacterium sp. BFFFF1]OYU79665.1 MAG: MarR family transcriptional regulator [Flavobacterium sp. BFFFF1]